MVLESKLNTEFRLNGDVCVRFCVSVTFGVKVMPLLSYDAARVYAFVSNFFKEYAVLEEWVVMPSLRIR